MKAPKNPPPARATMAAIAAPIAEITLPVEPAKQPAMLASGHVMADPPVISLKATTEPDKKPDTDHFHPSVKMVPDHPYLRAWVVAVAIVLAACAAYFSVTGMEAIFPGAGWGVIVMAGVMEVAKLTGVAWLSRKWRELSGKLRVTLVALLAVLAAINAVGVYGQLTKAHLSPHTNAVAVNSELAAAAQVNVEAQQAVVAGLDKQIAQIDAAIDESTKRGRATTAMTLASDQRTLREKLFTDRTTAALKLAGLRARAAEIAGNQARAEADIGVLEYAAELAGTDREKAIRWLILAMTFACDPTAMVLIAATARRG